MENFKIVEIGKICKRRIKAFFSKIRNFVYKSLGFQCLSHPIGRVKIPQKVKHLLKRSVAQQGEDLILDRIITRILNWDLEQPRVYVDVGAYHAIDHSVTYLLYQRGWSGIVFDPSAATKKTFCSSRPRDIFVQAVVGEEDNIDVDFFFAQNDSDMSLINTKYPEEKQRYRPQHIRQVCLENELCRHGIQSIDFLNIDVEGAELEILRSFDFEKFSPSIIAVEIHGNDIEKCLQSEEAKIIMTNGYRAVGCSVITYFFVKN